MWPYWKQVFADVRRGDEILPAWGGPSVHDVCPVWRPSKDTETLGMWPRGKRGRDGAEAATSQGRPWIASRHQKLRGAERSFARSFGGNMALTAPFLLTPTLQNCERTNVYYYDYFKLINVWLCLVFIAARELFLWLGARAPHRGGCSCGRAWAPGCPGFSSWVTWAQQLRLRGSRARAQTRDAPASLLQGMWDLPGSQIEPESPALAGRFFATETPGKPQFLLF